MQSYAETVAPIASLFSASQMESLLYAFLPVRLEAYKTGIYAIDTFVVTASVTLLLVLFKLMMTLMSTMGRKNNLMSHNEISVMVEATHYDDYHSTPNIYHQALSRLISIHAQENKHGLFKLKSNTESDHEEKEPPSFLLVPQPDQAHTIRHGENSFKLTFQSTEKKGNYNHGDVVLPGSEFSKPGIRSSRTDEPFICVTLESTNNQQTVSTVSDFLHSITRDYMCSLQQKKTQSRFEYAASGKWVRLCALYPLQGLETVALSPANEVRIKEDLDSFLNNKAFYKRVGFPYKRGIALFGPPGTGKTSLVFAVASQLKRDLYFINLAYLDSDAELFQAFSNVPAHAIVVFEDIDTMSSALSPRQQVQEEEAKFNLGAFLSILDGHTLEDGIIFIMTTNHPERLDPAIIRPGRMDVHLVLTYATFYQMRCIYRMVMDEDDTSTLDDVYPDLEKDMREHIIPPSEVMQIMVLYRNNTTLIPQQLVRLMEHYSNL